MSKFEIRLIKKECGMTSFSSLGSIKKENRGEKVGHAGTLDKFASGLMLVMIGNATKLNPVFSSFGKRYIATIKFGEETDTLDPEGTVIATSALPSYDDVLSSVNSFLGPQLQMPPVYSALHVDGKRAYIEARKGHDVEMPLRPICIHSISLLSYNDGIAVIDVSVSKGTYIRSLARDIALKINARAHLIALERTELGPFSYNDINKNTEELLDKTGLLSSVILNERFKKEIDNGFIRPDAIISDSDEDKLYCYLYFGSIFYGIGEKKDGRLRIISRAGNAGL